MESKFKGTRFEWYIDGEHIVAESGDCRTNETICDINPSTEYNTVYERSPTEAKANAQLIAASPTMLQALLEINRFYMNTGDAEEFLTGIQDKMKLVKQAITAALGTEKEVV